MSDNKWVCMHEKITKIGLSCIFNLMSEVALVKNSSEENDKSRFELHF
jgi:hypothetical protein